MYRVSSVSAKERRWPPCWLHWWALLGLVRLFTDICAVGTSRSLSPFPDLWSAAAPPSVSADFCSYRRSFDESCDSDFCIAAAGFLPRGELSDAIFLPSFSTPTLHILGKTDVIVVEERSKTLIDISSNCRVEYHDGGEFFCDTLYLL